MKEARVAELADAPDLGSGAERRAGSSPVSGRILQRQVYDRRAGCATNRRRSSTAATGTDALQSLCAKLTVAFVEIIDGRETGNSELLLPLSIVKAA